MNPTPHSEPWLAREAVKQLLLAEDALFKRIGRPKPRLLLAESMIAAQMRDGIPECAHLQPVLERVSRIDPSRGRAEGQKIRAVRKDLVRTIDACWKKPPPSARWVQARIQRKTDAPMEPILDVGLNLRETYKNVLLLLDHLEHKRKRCLQCMKKHSLLIESYIDEAYTLDETQQHTRLLNQLRRSIQRVQIAIVHRSKYADALVDLRKMAAVLESRV